MEVSQGKGWTIMEWAQLAATAKMVTLIRVLKGLLEKLVLLLGIPGSPGAAKGLLQQLREELELEWCEVRMKKRASMNSISTRAVRGCWDRSKRRKLIQGTFLSNL